MNTASSGARTGISRPLISLAAGLAGVAFAGLGEFLIASGRAAPPGALFYVLGIVLFAAGSAPLTNIAC